MLLLARWLHVLAAVTWIGGMLFIALVLVPVSRRLPDPALRAQLIRDTGRRFRVVGWLALGLLVVSGLANLGARPFLLRVPIFHWKLALVVVALVLSALHDFVLGPRAGLPTAARTWRARATWMARVNVAVVLVVVLLGLALRG